METEMEEGRDGGIEWETLQQSQSPETRRRATEHSAGEGVRKETRRLRQRPEFK